MSIEEATPKATRKNTPKWVLPVSTFAAGLLVGVGATLLVSTATEASNEGVRSDAQESPLAAAAEACTLHKEVAAIEDDGRTLIFEMQGEKDFSGGKNTELWCLLKELDAPESLKSLMGKTTSLQGRQTETWDTYKATWTYHPDKGLDTIITVVDD